ncbi:MAG: hypothetical protein HY854_16345 [Burkholderiales bacterium]|nr:hypothetical protein [Burkholderiales bacterium]
MRTFQLIGLAALLAAGCATEQASPVDANFGRAVNGAKAAQVADPAAATRSRPAATTDGQAARSAVELYEKTYTQPPAPGAVFNIGIGGGASSSGGR